MRCDRCGLESPAGFRFCGSCGAPLAAGEGLALREERKLVTALFCDLVGFTQRAERMDPEDVHRLLRVYYASARDVLERFGGTVAKFIGDAVFGVFGAPRAHEDDAARAVRAALATLEALADLNANDPGLDLHVRIGVTTGEALVTFDPVPGRDEGVAWGDMLNTAARLEAAAAADTILVDEATHRATHALVDYEAAAPIRAKGKAEPVAVWRPRAPRRHRLGLAARRPPAGRSWTATTSCGCSSRASTTPTSTAPRGWSRSSATPASARASSILELFRRAETHPEPPAWRLGRSPPYPEGVAFWALSEIIKGQAGVLETDGAAAAEDKLRQTVLDLVPATDAARIETHLLGLLGLRAAAEARGDQREAAFAAWRQFLEALARRRPLVLVFEDLHWADDGLLDFIEHVAEWARDVPLLVLATTRPEVLARRERWGAHASATTLALAPLSAGDTRTLVSLTSMRPMPAEVTDAVVARASGNPLYAVEFVSMLAERRLVAAGAEELPLPDSLRGIIAARLDLLSAEEKALLHAGAVIGRAFWPAALAAILERPRRWVDERLRMLAEKELLVRARRSSLGREAEYRFRHVLIRDVAYDEIPRAAAVRSTGAPPNGSRRSARAGTSTGPSCSLSTGCARTSSPARPVADGPSSPSALGWPRPTRAIAPSPSAPSLRQRASTVPRWSCGPTMTRGARCSCSASASRRTTPRRRAATCWPRPGTRCWRRATAGPPPRPRPSWRSSLTTRAGARACRSISTGPPSS